MALFRNVNCGFNSITLRRIEKWNYSWSSNVFISLIVVLNGTMVFRSTNALLSSYLGRPFFLTLTDIMALSNSRKPLFRLLMYLWTVYEQFMQVIKNILNAMPISLFLKQKHIYKGRAEFSRRNKKVSLIILQCKQLSCVYSKLLINIIVRTNTCDNIHCRQ